MKTMTKIEVKELELAMIQLLSDLKDAAFENMMEAVRLGDGDHVTTWSTNMNILRSVSLIGPFNEKFSHDEALDQLSAYLDQPSVNPLDNVIKFPGFLGSELN